MKISLERLDARALQVDLPGSEGERIVIGAATGLRGSLEQHAGGLSLSGVAAESLVLEALRVLLGQLVLSSATGATLEGLALTLEQSAAHLTLDVTAVSLRALDLTVAVDDVVVTGRVVLGAARLTVRDDEGSLEAERLELSGFGLRIGEVEVAAEALSGLGVAIRWGAAGFSLAARSLEGPTLRLTTKELHLAGSGVAVTALALDDRHVEVGTLTLAGASVALSLTPHEPAAAPAPPAPALAPPTPPAPAPLLDWHVLDSLSGQVDVDVEVDLTVPIIGSRNATHRLRVPIERGSIDFRALENDLSALENALLDFSVRDGALVLERVNPLFPARGHGKPIVVWDLDETDRVVAETNRVRLAVLPHARLAPSDDAPKSGGESSGSSLALRKLGFNRIDMRLTLAPIEGPLTGRLRPRRIDSLVVQGSVFHHPGAAPRAASLLAESSGASLSLAGLRLGTTGLDVSSMTFASLSPIEIAFVDVHPTNVKVEMAGVAFEGVGVTLG